MHSVPVIICLGSLVLLPIEDLVATPLATRSRGVTLTDARGWVSCMEDESTVAVAGGERVGELTPAAAVELAEMVRSYRRAHSSGERGRAIWET